MFRNFELRHIFLKRIAPKWLEIDQKNLCTKFLASNVDFSSQSLDSLRPKVKKACARERQRGVPL